MFFKQLLQSSIVRLALIAMVLCSVTLLGSRSTGQAKAAAALSTSNTVSEMISPACTVQSLGANYLYNTVAFISTDCTLSTGGIDYFFVPADSKKANQVLSISLMAQATGRKVVVQFDPNDTSGIPSDLVGHSRKIVELGLGQ